MNTRNENKSTMLQKSFTLSLLFLQVLASIPYFLIKILKPLFNKLGIVLYKNSKTFFISFNDVVFLHRNGFRNNFKKLLFSGFTLFLIFQIFSLTVAHSASAIESVAKTSTLTKKETSDVNKHISKLGKTPIKFNENNKLTNTVLPNGDFMPQGIKYVQANALKDSPAYAGSTFNVVDKLFTNPVNQDEVFFNKIAYGSQVAAKSYGVNPSVLMAQAALESDWGNSELAANDNNYFGIKGSYNGQSVRYLTTEETASGKSYQIYADFAKIPSNDIAFAMSANAKLLRYGPGAGMPTNYYSGTWVENTNSYSDATASLTRKYATDVTYNQKLNKIIEYYGLYVLDNHTVHNPELSK